ncbi:hypothetical protein BHM03_00019716 [Ensete ventricosum]|nr:hypothetical protein BHM03_00019716 [Ensete ventricosum]
MFSFAIHKVIGDRLVVDGAEGLCAVGCVITLVLRASWFNLSSCSRAKEIAAVIMMVDGATSTADGVRQDSTADAERKQGMIAAMRKSGSCCFRRLPLAVRDRYWQRCAVRDNYWLGEIAAGSVVQRENAAGHVL